MITAGVSCRPASMILRLSGRPCCAAGSGISATTPGGSSCNPISSSYLLSRPRRRYSSSSPKRPAKNLSTSAKTSSPVPEDKVSPNNNANANSSSNNSGNSSNNNNNASASSSLQKNSTGKRAAKPVPLSSLVHVPRTNHPSVQAIALDSIFKLDGPLTKSLDSEAIKSLEEIDDYEYLPWITSASGQEHESSSVVQSIPAVELSWMAPFNAPPNETRPARVSKDKNGNVSYSVFNNDKMSLGRRGDDDVGYDGQDIRQVIQNGSPFSSSTGGGRIKGRITINGVDFGDIKGFNDSGPVEVTSQVVLPLGSLNFGKDSAPSGIMKFLLERIQERVDAGDQVPATLYNFGKHIVRMHLTSVQRKRKLKMKKHKLQKRRKAQRALRRKHKR